jgi:hypothetical protein
MQLSSSLSSTSSSSTTRTQNEQDPNTHWLPTRQRPSSNSNPLSTTALGESPHFNHTRRSSYSYGGFFGDHTNALLATGPATNLNKRRSDFFGTNKKELQLEESKPLLDFNSPYYPHPSSNHTTTTTATATDGGQLLSNNATFQRGHDEAVRRDIHHFLHPHPIAHTIDEDRQRGTGSTTTTAKEKILPTLFDNPPSPVKAGSQLPHPRISRDVEMTSIRPRLTTTHNREKQSASPFFRSFLNRHTMLTSVEVYSSSKIYACLVLPLLVCWGVLKIGLVSTYDVWAVSSARCLSEQSTSMVVSCLRSSDINNFQADNQSFSVLFQFSPSRALANVDLDTNYSTPIQQPWQQQPEVDRYFYNMIPNIQSQVTVHWAPARNVRLSVHIEAYAINENPFWGLYNSSSNSSIPLVAVNLLPVLYGENSQSVVIPLPAIDVQLQQLTVEHSIYFNVTGRIDRASKSDSAAAISGVNEQTVERSLAFRSTSYSNAFQNVTTDLQLKYYSRNYIYRTAVVYAVISLTFAVLFVIYCIRIVTNGHRQYVLLVQNLPIVYKPLFSNKQFILPEQYTVLAALYVLIFVFNPLQSGFTVLQQHSLWLRRNEIALFELNPLFKCIGDLTSTLAFFGKTLFVEKFVLVWLLTVLW